MSELTKEERQALAYVFSPEQSRQKLISTTQKIYGTVGVSSGSGNIDRIMIPTRGSWVRSWVALPGNCKSAMCRVMAKLEAMRLVKNEDYGHYVAYITYEESPEIIDLAFADKENFSGVDYWHGRVHPDAIKNATAKRGEMPLYTFAMSDDRLRPDSPPMTIDTCLHAMRALYKRDDILPSLIIVDYAQEIMVERPSGNRTADVIQGMRSVVNMARMTGAAVELAVQAKQTVLDRIKSNDKDNPTGIRQNFFPVPGKGDIEYSNFIWQASTNVVGLCRVSETHPPEIQPEIKFGTASVKNHNNMMIARPIKRKPGGTGLYALFLLDPDKLEIYDIDTRTPYG